MTHDLTHITGEAAILRINHGQMYSLKAVLNQLARGTESRINGVSAHTVDGNVFVQFEKKEWE